MRKRSPHHHFQPILADGGYNASQAETRYKGFTIDGLPHGESASVIVTGSAAFEVDAASGRRDRVEDHDIRAALDRHWAASDANDFEAEHQIYRDDAVLEYPQSGERIRGRRNIHASRLAPPK